MEADPCVGDGLVGVGLRTAAAGVCALVDFVADVDIGDHLKASEL
jgi:hypothetical protein